MNTISIDDTVSFIRRHNLLKLWSDEQIKVAINKAVSENALAFEVDRFSKLRALALCRWINDNLYIIAFAGKGRMKVLLDHLKYHFPLCEYISCERYGMPRTFSVKKLQGLTARFTKNNLDL